MHLRVVLIDDDARFRHSLELLVAASDGAPLTAAVARTLLELVRRQPQDRSPPTGLSLSPRERDVLRAFVGGQSCKQAADAFGISIDTVRFHVRGLYRALQVHSVADAVVWAVREGLV
jgi:two-component system nitrate/nitrite response regulator NarL